MAISQFVVGQEHAHHFQPELDFENLPVAKRQVLKLSNLQLVVHIVLYQSLCGITNLSSKFHS